MHASFDSTEFLLKFEFVKRKSKKPPSFVSEAKPTEESPAWRANRISQIHEKANLCKFRFPFSALRFPYWGRRGKAPVRPVPRHVFFELLAKRKRGEGLQKKAIAFLPIGKQKTKFA